MASLTAHLLPPLLLQDRKTLFGTFPKLPVSYTGGRRNCAVFVKATGDSSESSTSLSIVKSVRNVWDKSDEDRVGLIGLGFAAIVALWTSTNLISWFIYRYLLFKPDREELFQIINKSLSQIFG
ncbi:protein CURVATURE THYLAKOID 1C, chloroplastic isoform X2 [Gossypium raimondii]|uniref:protein CURVATURE THYLAKOID 1C, chloroplastic isoform X2 n=1 Tax=Gossypium raimondii TaxID=29730 RepID=UPI00227C68A4|nr:protein CURVATURE THYLAKOID 1C, chloroplastic isoform X2 [Gossypium raimondii]